MPSINSVVEVTTRYKTNMFFADKKGYQTFTKKGKVVVAPKGASADSFALQHDYLSVINLGKVINMKILKGNSIDIQSFIVKGKGGTKFERNNT